MILLSSYGLSSPIISEKAKKYLKPGKRKVLVVTYACSPDTVKEEVEKGLIPFGYKKEDVRYLNLFGSGIKPEDKFELIYVPGGDPFLLVKLMNMTGNRSYLKSLIKEGAHYFGFSAGADFAGENLEYLKTVEDCNCIIEDFSGLGLIKEKVLCHADQRDMATLKRVRDYDERKTLFLRNDELYVIKGDLE